MHNSLLKMKTNSPEQKYTVVKGAKQQKDKNRYISNTIKAKIMKT